MNQVYKWQLVIFLKFISNYTLVITVDKLIHSKSKETRILKIKFIKQWKNELLLYR